MHTSCDHCSRADHRPIADGHSLKDDCAGTDPYIASNPNSSHNKRLFGHQPRARGSMVVICYVTERPDHAITAYFYTVRRIEHRKTIDVCAPANDHFARLAAHPSCQQHDFVIQCGAIVNKYIPRISRGADAPDPTAPADMDAEQPQSGDAQAHSRSSRVSYRAIDKIVAESTHAQFDLPQFTRRTSSVAATRGKAARYLMRPSAAFQANVDA
jgi:hypothetical protein